MNFIDLHKQQNLIKESIDKRIKKVLNHGKYILGPEVKELEQNLAEYVGRKYAIGVGSGTDALLMSLMAYDIKKDDAVFTTPFTFIATASMIRLLGATPVFSDILPDTFNIDPKKLRETIINTIENTNLKPKAIITVDLFGQLANYNEITKIAKEFNLILIEDAAQSFGASFNGHKSCSFGDISTTSFFPAKPLGCYGDGGMIFTDDEEIYKKLLSIRVHGKNEHDKYDNIRLGINGRLDTIQAAVLLSKMEIFDNEINLRNDIAKKYNDKLKKYLKTPYLKQNHISAWAQYTLQTINRKKIMEHLQKNNIPTAIYYPKPLHLQGIFSYLGYKKGDFPISEELSEKVFSLPFYPYLNDEDIEMITSKIIEVFK
jgi:UDP-2-acetamido-2-deoxy-ribo-hexuluronate aminotransferase